MPYYGFNFQWMFSSSGAGPSGAVPMPPDVKALDFLAKHGFNFIRIPTDYRFWTKDFDYFHLNERVFENLDAMLQASKARGIRLSLNVHRAPGYCINRTTWSGTISGGTRSPRTPLPSFGRRLRGGTKG